ncbi:acyltransferase family protein [Arthrobacter sp. MMS18-M83]|uniref:acyltransferase family protein n=1 Tax=Arthrobacter sp. MMS18-M83 TaxID=2996261 RepID=UPI00227B9E02|nr:acyltransferase [Arthrobacter sp. MMS18-M83]WAH96523.1 acyltransferase [Arthrobacter sp. MMS18-M83]
MSTAVLKPNAIPAPMIGNRLDPRGNSLNLIRLVLAFMVLLAHSWHIVGDGNGWGFRGENLGGWAVAGFFGISGYLITASRFSNRIGPYLVHRVARIFPAFIVCLVVMAFGFAPIAYLIQHGSLQGFLHTPTTPLNSIFANMTLHIVSYDIAGTPAGVPYAKAWNGSLWTLYFEFLCYLLVALIGFLPLFKKTPWPMIGAFVLSVVLWANIDALKPYLQSNLDFELAARLVPYFLGGAVVQVLSSRIGIHKVAGPVAIVLAGLSIFLVDGFGGQLAAPFIAYGLLWISTWLPQPAFVAQHDISYGAYIYAFPVQQFLAVFGGYHWGVWWFTLAATACTIPLAAASWFFVERPVMRRAKKSV